MNSRLLKRPDAPAWPAFRWLLWLLGLLFAVALAQSGCRAEVASWYGESHRGRPMANTRPFDPDALTCASWFHPLGTRLRVVAGDRSVAVTVTDRGPDRRLLATRQLDLSRAAFRRLAPLREGLVTVAVAVEVVP